MSDTVFGAFVLAVFLVFVFVLGKVIYEVKNRRFVKAWGPLVPIVNGTVTGDGGGGATSWLTGTYRGRRVQATMVPDRNRYSGESGFRYNYYDVALLDVPGRQDWSLEEGRIATKDKALESSLISLDVASLVAPFGSTTVEYRRQTNKLQLSEDCGPVWVPMPERFVAELELLLKLAEMNASANAM
ncbi:MAG: hypothetical protein ABUT39_18495 [Acidobacteriota bacterium]